MTEKKRARLVEFSVCMDSKMISELDEYVTKMNYLSRGDLIRDACREKLSKTRIRESGPEK